MLIPEAKNYLLLFNTDIEFLNFNYVVLIHIAKIILLNYYLEHMAADAVYRFFYSQ